MSPTQPDRRPVLACVAACLAYPNLIMNLAHAHAHAASDLPLELLKVVPDARLLGSGVLRFFGLRVYEARLWAAPGFKPDAYAQHPFALELHYGRKLEGEAIAERSLAEMRRVGAFTEAQATRWMTLMRQAFPDVVAQDKLLGLHEGQGEVRFFHNGRLTAQIRDADYARLFFGIWLAPQTSAPALRQSLLGLPA